MAFASRTRTPQSMPAKFDWFLAKNGRIYSFFNLHRVVS
ncbi:hypothetical protein AO376_1039 [Moraxella catarrhalis]|nr:hypothetical protein AO376_1039 [Moraxella catarrhalis]OAV16236.1 hypothetical protein AO374_1723 [Moraxella catarrhalis]